MKLIDLTARGNPRPWDDKKRLCRTIELAVFDSDVSDDLKERARRIGGCAEYLVYRQARTGEKELERVYFCRERLCPMCQWRLSLRKFINMTGVMEYLKSDRFLFLTLTVKNCDGENLRKTINAVRKGFVRMYNQRLKYREYKTKESSGFSTGFYYTIEVTYNESRDTYHPHMHILLDVKSSYLNKNYISMDGWRALWRKYMSLDYTPQVDARILKKGAGGVQEISKYLTKPSNYVTYDDLVFTARQFEILDRELAGVRTTATGGTFREAFRDLRLDDDIRTTDLIHGDGRITEGYVTRKYIFNGNNYELVV